MPEFTRSRLLIEPWSQRGVTRLQISVNLDGPEEKPIVGQTSNESALEEEDSEAVIKSTAARSPSSVRYEAIHSATYQVPVLYINFQHSHISTANHRLPLPDEVYELLVPQTHRAHVNAVGVVGALSVTDHPVESCPTYFVHPCRTVEVMASMAGVAPVRPEEYLLRWLGTMGQSVGLDVPIEVAAMLGTR